MNSGANSREDRLARARAILHHEKFLTLSKREQNKVLDELMTKGLSLSDVKLLLAEVISSLAGLKSLLEEVVEEKKPPRAVPTVKSFVSPKKDNFIVTNNDAAYLQTLPYHVFVDIITRGNIEGADLLRLCNSSQVLTGYCNRSQIVEEKEQKQFLFRQLLRKMGKPVKPGDNARDLYIDHTVRIPFLFNSISKKLRVISVISGHLNTTLNPEGHEIEYYPTNMYQLLYSPYNPTGLLVPAGKLPAIFYDLRYEEADPKLRPWIMKQETLREEIAKVYPADDESLAKIITLNMSLRGYISTGLRAVTKLKHIHRFGLQLLDIEKEMNTMPDPIHFEVIDGLRAHGDFDDIISEAKEPLGAVDSERLLAEFRLMVTDYIRPYSTLTPDEIKLIIGLHRRFMAGKLDLSLPFTLESFL